MNRQLLAVHAFLRDSPIPYLLVPLVLAGPVWLADRLPALGQTELAIIAVFLSLAMALLWGRGPGLFTAVGSVATFDYFFVAPLHSFAVDDRRYLLTFSLMLAVSALGGEATAHLRFRARRVAAREASVRVRFELARDLSGCGTLEEICQTADRAIQRELGAGALVLRKSPSADGLAPALEADLLVVAQQLLQAAWMPVADDGAPRRLPGRAAWVVPVQTANHVLGLLVLPDGRRTPRPLVDLESVESFAALIALALERVAHVDLAEAARQQAARSEVRHAVLSALSHDLRAPLSSLCLAVETLARNRDQLTPRQASLVDECCEGTRRMHRMTGNLLELARFQAGGIRLRREWVPFDEVLAASLAHGGAAAAPGHLRVTMEPEPCMIHVDAVAFERVLWNLLDNARTHVGPAVVVTLAAVAQDGQFLLRVEDDGPGLPAAVAQRLQQGSDGSLAAPGGLGLAICRAIVEAHEGHFAVTAPVTGAGACFDIRLPQVAWRSPSAAGSEVEDHIA